MDSDLLIKRMRELAHRASVRPGACYTHFLDPTQAQSAFLAAREKGVQLALCGGYPDCERAMAAFYLEAEDEPQSFPFECVRLSWNPKFGSPGHRDLLGALMALGFERECMGDIVLAEGCAYVFAQPETARYIVANLTGAGRITVEAEIVEGAPPLPPPAGRTVKDTVASLRLDAVLSAGFDLSRGQASELIARQVVLVNHVLCENPSATLSEGDVISVRGHGRFRLTQVGGLTRKGRLGITLFRYGE